MDIGDLLRKGVEVGCSDLHLSAGMPPMMRIDGDMQRIKAPDMEHKDVYNMVYDIMNDKQRKDYLMLANWSVDQLEKNKEEVNTETID